jgi:hypothetical protein
MCAFEPKLVYAELSIQYVGFMCGGTELSSLLVVVLTHPRGVACCARCAPLPIAPLPQHNPKQGAITTSSSSSSTTIGASTAAGPAERPTAQPYAAADGSIRAYHLLQPAPLGRWSVSLIQWVYHALESCVAWAWAPALSSFRRSPGPLGSLYRLLRAYGIVGIRRVHVGLGAWCFFLHFF